MMRKFLLLWVLPIASLALWYGLSANDVSFGLWFLSREMHDYAFSFYAAILGVEPETIPPLLVRALLFDTALVVAILLFRRRKVISAYVGSRWSGGSARSKAASLSSAP